MDAFIALKCDLCNGNLVIDDSRKFAVCEFCGTKYMASTLRAKIQEIKGTVRVEGAVETTTGNTEKERLIKNAITFLRIGRLSDAKNTIETIIKQFPDDYRGWWYKFILPFEEYIQTGGHVHIDYDIDYDLYSTAYKLCPDKSVFGEYFCNFIKWYGKTPHISPQRTYSSYYNIKECYNSRLESINNKTIDIMTESLLYCSQGIITILPEVFVRFIHELTNTYVQMVMRGDLEPISLKPPTMYNGKWESDISNISLKKIFKQFGIRIKISSGNWHKYKLIYEKTEEEAEEYGPLIGCWICIGDGADNRYWILLR